MTGVVTPYSIAFSGLALTVGAVHPFGMLPYMNSISRRSPGVTALAWTIAMACCLYAIYGAISGQRQAVWFVFPALCYWFMLTDPKPAKKQASGDTAPDATEGMDA